jgi:hypothetical protein
MTRWVSSVATVTGVRAGRPTNRVSIPGKEKLFFCSPKHPKTLWAHPELKRPEDKKSGHLSQMPGMMNEWRYTSIRRYSVMVCRWSASLCDTKRFVRCVFRFYLAVQNCVIWRVNTSVRYRLMSSGKQHGMLRTNMLLPSSDKLLYTQKMTVAVQPRMLVIFYQTACCDTQEDRNIRIYRCESLIFQLIPLFWCRKDKVDLPDPS